MKAAIRDFPERLPAMVQTSRHGAVGSVVRPVQRRKMAASASVIGRPSTAHSQARHAAQDGPNIESNKRKASAPSEARPPFTPCDARRLLTVRSPLQVL